IRFLNAINAQVPADKAIHVILDNYAAHKHPKVRAWLDRHQRFIPTSAVSDSQGFPRGFESESMQQTGGLRWVQQFCCVMISMGV
ncbi:hypothetical protein V3589_32600, partial [Sinorhizobium fredii]